MLKMVGARRAALQKVETNKKYYKQQSAFEREKLKLERISPRQELLLVSVKRIN